MDLLILLRLRPYCRALVNFAEGIPRGRADQEEIYYSNDILVLQIWGISQRGPGIASCGWEYVCKRYEMSNLGQQLSNWNYELATLLNTSYHCRPRAL